MDFPVIQTNFWDGVIAVPLVVLITQIFKIFPIPHKFIPTIATLVGFTISIFFSHRHDLWAGFFMGGFYGVAAVGTYASLKTSWLSFRKQGKYNTKEKPY